jgi:hypothetical protein
VSFEEKCDDPVYLTPHIHGTGRPLASSLQFDTMDTEKRTKTEKVNPHRNMTTIS